MATTKREREDAEDTPTFTIQDYQSALANLLVQTTKLRKTVSDQSETIADLRENMKTCESLVHALKDQLKDEMQKMAIKKEEEQDGIPLTLKDDDEHTPACEGA